MAEEEPGEALNASRVAPAVFPLETFDALVFELREGLSFLAKRKYLLKRRTLKRQPTEKRHQQKNVTAISAATSVMKKTTGLLHQGARKWNKKRKTAKKSSASESMPASPASDEKYVPNVRGATTAAEVVSAAASSKPCCKSGCS